MNKRKYLLVGIVAIAIVLSTAGSLGSNFVGNKNAGNNVGTPASVGAVLEVTTDKTAYCLGEPVTIFLTNVGDEILSAGGPIVTIYNNEEQIIYQEACYCWWELEPGEYITWPSWDQTDKQGNQVPVGEYVVEGFLSGGGENYVDTAIFFIIDDIPSGSPFGPTEGVINVEYIFCIKLPDDPECEPYYLMWDWGDGTMGEWLGPYGAGEIVCVTYSWNEPGDYGIRVKIRDSCDNEYWTDPLTIHIYENNAPKAPVIKGPTNPRVGRECHYKFNAVDPDGDDVSYFIDLGDGVTIGWTRCLSSDKDLHVYHSWNEEGTYTIKAKAKDCPHGVESLEASLTITVSKTRAINTPFLNFLQQYPYLFPILRLLLQRLGLQ